MIFSAPLTDSSIITEATNRQVGCYKVSSGKYIPVLALFVMTMFFIIIELEIKLT